ncbi:CRE-DAAM-1 protein [Aphelenchoides avenae]|nr:CRE-DAAM-1 protein [Aphelenchus avenae]
MLEAVVDRAWSCFNKLAPDKKPPDRKPTVTVTRALSDAEAYASRFKQAGLMKLHPDSMPEKSQLEAAFRKLLEELDLSPEKQRQLNDQPAEKKWLMIVEQSIRTDKAQQSGTCEGWVRLLEGYVRSFPDHYALPLAIQRIEALAISLRTESFSYVQKFVDADGVGLLTELLNQANERGNDCFSVPLLCCFKALLNCSIGRAYVLESADTLLAIAGSLDVHSSRCKVGSRKKVLCLEILSGLCLVPEGGHRAVLKALSDVTGILGERTRFQRIVDELHREQGSPRDTERMRIALMSLVNALLKSGPAEQSLEFRLHLRYEFLMLGLQEVIDRLRNAHGSTLEDHFDLFEMMRQEDEQELASSVDSGSSSPVDFESPSGMAEALSRKLDNSVALPHLISLLQHLLLIPGDERHLPLWRLFDLILQQLSLQTAMGNLAEADTQFAQPLSLDMDELISRLRTQHEYEQLERQLANATHELESERKRVVELENRLSDLQDGLSISSFSRISDLSSNPSDPCHSPTPTISSTNSSTLPPIRPPSSAPPPPPPSAGQLRALGGPMKNPAAPAKKVPKPSCTLRTLNWTPLPPIKIPNTIWENAEDEKMYSQIDLQDLAISFASGKGSADDADSAMNTLQRRLRTETSISVIDSRRSQNCTIMLSKLKLTHREIRNSLLSMDEKGKLPKDMLEQMLKFIPTKDELSMLQDTVCKHKTPAVLALADRFLFEMGQIPRFEQRLKCLHVIRTFQERIDELKPHLNAVIRASTVLPSNKRLKQLLTVILAVGNYLNHGKRIGNAQGIKIHSISSVHGVKSAIATDRNLLHHIVEIVEAKFPDLLRLKRELNSVYEAARYNRSEMDVEMRNAQEALRTMANELMVHRKQSAAERPDLEDSFSPPPDEPTSDGASPSKTTVPKQKGDKFVSVVSSFLESARKQYAELEQLNQEMQRKFEECSKFFAEEPRSCPPDEFFGIFAQFLNQFAECYQTIWEQREEVERVKRQTLARSIFAKKGGRRKGLDPGGGKDFERLVNALQSGEIFSEELNRLRTSIRVPQRKRAAATARR